MRNLILTSCTIFVLLSCKGNSIENSQKNASDSDSIKMEFEDTIPIDTSIVIEPEERVDYSITPEYLPKIDVPGAYKSAVEAYKDAIKKQKAYEDEVITKESEAEFGGGMIGDGDYFLCDITKDGIPELFLCTKGAYYAEIATKIYSYDGTLKLLYEENDFGPYYYQGKDYVIWHFIHAGSESIAKISYENGKLKFEEIISGEYGDLDSKKYIKEPRVKQYDYTDLRAINAIKK